MTSRARPRKQQVRDVGARDQEDHGDDRHDREQRLLVLARERRWSVGRRSCVEWLREISSTARQPASPAVSSPRAAAAGRRAALRFPDRRTVPVFSRAITRSHHQDRWSSALSAVPRISGSSPSGSATSYGRPWSSPVNSGGVTPITVSVTRFSTSGFPTTSAAPRKCRCQKRVAHDDDRAVLPTASLIVRLRERAAENRRDAEDVEEAAAGEDAVGVLGLAAVGEVVSRAAVRERPVKELPIAPPQLFPERIRPRRPLRVRPAAARAAGVP